MKNFNYRSGYADAFIGVQDVAQRGRDSVMYRLGQARAKLSVTFFVVAVVVILAAEIIRKVKSC